METCFRLKRNRNLNRDFVNVRHPLTSEFCISVGIEKVHSLAVAVGYKNKN